MSDCFKPIHTLPPKPVTGFALIVVLFILLVIVGTAYVTW
ncbi:YjcZ family sporulation protein [Anaerobacillus arseniciselenatis]|nr:YjcZ family sporulation protein [Anaerobacillus arseniciselenatis]